MGTAYAWRSFSGRAQATDSSNSVTLHGWAPSSARRSRACWLSNICASPKRSIPRTRRPCTASPSPIFSRGIAQPGQEWAADRLRPWLKAKSKDGCVLLSAGCHSALPWDVSRSACWTGRAGHQRPQESHAFNSDNRINYDRSHIRGAFPQQPG
jgi:hypothetical protein